MVGSGVIWFRSGQEAFSAMLIAIESARQSVRLETYTYASGHLGQRFLNALLQAKQRGASVQVLIDAFGSYGLPSAFWASLEAAGGQVRQFNPLSLHRLGIRNHRKCLVCDDRIAFVGGFNIASYYDGDGVTVGWRDLGLSVEGPMAVELAASFDEMFLRAEFQHKRFMRLRRFDAKRVIAAPSRQLLLSGPGRGPHPIKRALRRDLAQARDVIITAAYFLPSWRLRRALARVVHRGGRVRLLLAAKSDIAVSQLAGQSLYRRFLRAGVELYEYLPQILHAKLIVSDDVVYAGSANLDQRSLNINYELMIRFAEKEIANEARGVSTDLLKNCRRITPQEWRKSRTPLRKLREHLAYLLLVRLDPYIARRQWRSLPE